MKNEQKKEIEKKNCLIRRIEIHEEKKKQAEEENKQELVDYYDREIKAKKKTLEESQEILDKQSSILINHPKISIQTIPEQEILMVA